ncbi:competence protein CoiA [Proteus sp. G4398]|uniref:competence protein CoiA n=1 Tax=Proteus sp. G4398 TaxID=2698854 RepID=UPI0013783D95|nr:competence protein CoiA family protein [Proteus sp. G4398]NBN13221.1 competence protein CoiA [Proteus sp. G4398]
MWVKIWGGVVLTANTESGTRVIAHEAEKNGTRYFCPECNSEVTLKKGQVLTHHFAHKPPVTCYYGVGESEAHRHAKVCIYNALLQCEDVEQVEIEKSFDDVRADIFAVIKGTPVAIEIQKSTLKPETIIKRTEAYTRKGIYILWLLLEDQRIHEARFIPKWWEKWIHAAYFGKVFFWFSGEYVMPVSFDTAYTYVEATDWGGGYNKPLKRYKKPIFYDLISIVEDFIPSRGKAWNGGAFNIPDRLIFIQKRN